MNKRELTDKDLEAFQNQSLDKSKIMSMFYPALYKDKSSRNKSANTSIRNKKEIELVLYDDALKRRDLKNKLEINANNACHLASIQPKISKESYKIAYEKSCKELEATIRKHGNKDISFILLGEAFGDMYLFHELFRKQAQEFSLVKTYKKPIVGKRKKPTKEELEKIDEREARKKKELDFQEQIWIMLNQDNQEFIQSDLLIELLKILFSPNSVSQNEVVKMVENFIQELFGNGEVDAIRISPITNGPMKTIWNAEKLVGEFRELRENLIAYRHLNKVDNKNKDYIETIEKNLTFQPNKSIHRSNSNVDFLTNRLPVYMEREKLKERERSQLKIEKENDV